MFINLIYLSILFPIIGFLINGLFGSKIKNEKTIGIIGSGSVGISFLVILLAFIETVSLPVEYRTSIINLFTWINVSSLNVSFGYQVDQLSLIMSLVVTGVGFLIHIYSIGYMHGDKGFWRFFAYLNLFIFSMMNLVLADNFVLMFLGWEGVGLCSYLLIGFWYDKKFEKSTTSDAAKKAFIVNRIGDFGFLLGIFLIYLTFGSLKFQDVFLLADNLSISTTTITFIAIFLFIGATGKSAQIPLYIWLPDAMAGPTPVSALIHAATMVTAGVYMVSRCSILFVQSEVAMMIVAVVGALTAIFAATMGLVQNDIKKVLAYSTISQLGYMFLAAGVGAFSASIFHVFTHAFFKALLFLGAGSVIHALHEEQDIRKMGELKDQLPKTYKTFLIGILALSGIPITAGFFSKDEILWKTFADGNFLLYMIGLFTAFLTAFYSSRLFNLTFLGKKRYSQNIHPHESPNVMTIPLMILAFFSLFSGFLGLPALFGGESVNIFGTWLEPIYESTNKRLINSETHSHFTEALLMIISISVAITGIYLARHFYLKDIKFIDKIKTSFTKIYNLLFNKYYVDEVYDAIIVNPLKKVSEKLLWKITDEKIIDGAVNNTATLFEYLSGKLRLIQNGIAQFYALIIAAGLIILFTILFLI